MAKQRRKPAENAEKPTRRWQNPLVAAIVLIIVGLCVALLIRYGYKRTQTLQQAIAQQFNRSADLIQVNIPPLPGLYPGAVIVHPSIDQLAFLRSQQQSDSAQGGEFSIKGVTMTTASLTVHGQTDFVSQALSDSGKFSVNIDFAKCRVHEKDLLVLKKALLEDAEVQQAYKKGSRPEVVNRAYEAVMSITIRRLSAVSAQEWAKLKKQALESSGSLNADDSTTIVAEKPVICAFETVSVDYISKNLSPGKPDEVRLTPVIRSPKERFATLAPSDSNGAARIGFVSTYCGVYRSRDFHNLAGAEGSARLVVEAMKSAGGKLIAPLHDSGNLSETEFYSQIDLAKAQTAGLDALIFYHMGHAVSLGFGQLFLVMSDCEAALPEQNDFALLRHRINLEKGPGTGSGEGVLAGMIQAVEAESSPEGTAGLVPISTVYKRLENLQIPFALVIDGCYDRDDMEKLKTQLSMDSAGNYYGPNVSSSEEQLSYQHVMDSFGQLPYLRSTNVVILAAKPGSKAIVVKNPLSDWSFSPEVGPLAAKLASRLDSKVTWDSGETWAHILSGLASWRGTGEIDFKGSVSWSDFSIFEKLRLVSP